jgi:hypothetical protein
MSWVALMLGTYAHGLFTSSDADFGIIPLWPAFSWHVLYDCTYALLLDTREICTADLRHTDQLYALYWFVRTVATPIHAAA